MAFANGYSMNSTFNSDGLGWMYVVTTIVWTVVLLMGITFLIKRRHLPYLRIRNVPLAVGAAATLHVYWILCMIAYSLNGTYPCIIEFWVMSLYLPLGMALFQASNTQLLHIANIQRKYTQELQVHSTRDGRHQTSGWRQYLSYFRVQNRVKRTMAIIAYGMLAQIVVTLFIFLISRKFHAGFGLTGPSYSELQRDCDKLVHRYEAVSCEGAQNADCRHGWQWVPSIAWQFFWSWVYAPYLLWQVRDIQDVHNWRMQTTICSIVGMFGTPMWLCALYAREMARINRYFIPPLWFSPSIFLIEAFLIFGPLWQVRKNQRLQDETLEIISQWEAKNNSSSTSARIKKTASMRSKSSSTKSSIGSCRGDMYTMTTLESALRTNAQPLLMFAALKDFSGENISFLTKVLEWKRAWTVTPPATLPGFLRRPQEPALADSATTRLQFKRAVDIYTSYVSLRYSNYPINISHAHLKELDAIFGGAALMLHGHRFEDSKANSVTPFDIPGSFLRLWHTASRSHKSEDLESNPHHDAMSIDSQHTFATEKSTDPIIQTIEFSSKHQTSQQFFETTSTAAVDSLPDYIPVPPGFNAEVFDHAEDSVKYMVLTNTWPKFVNAGYAGTIVNEKKDLLSNIKRRLFPKQDQAQS